MSTTRRTTRASSRAASSRGASPAIEEQDIPGSPSSRHSTRRATANTPLPQVGLQTSNSYGTNQIAQSSSMRTPGMGDQIGSVLGGLLEPVPEDHVSDVRGGNRRATPIRQGARGVGRRAESSLASADRLERSFGMEANVFDGANLESSPIVDPSEQPGIPAYPTLHRRVDETPAVQSQRELVDEIARNTRVKRAPSRNVNATTARSTNSWINSKLVKSAFLIFLSIVAIYGLAKAISALGLPSSHSNTAPSASGTNDYYRSNEVSDLKKRMKIVESDIARLTRHTDLDSQTIERLQKLLPQVIVCKKDTDGDIIIPDDFWNALVDRIRKEDSIFEREINQGSKWTRKTGLSRKDVQSIAERAIEDSEKVWNRFLDKNKDRINNYDSDQFASKVYKNVEKYSETHQKVDKEEFIQAIRKNWDDTRYELQSQIGLLTKQLDTSLQKIQKLERSTLSKEQINRIASDVATKLIPHAKLSAQSNANININTNQALLRVNHFSRGTGAVIDPKLTSPKYSFPSMEVHIFKRALLQLCDRPVPRPKPAIVALERWEEHGDCYCSPSKDAKGFGPSIAVLTGNFIQPDHVVIEHIPETATLEPGAAPKDMEAYAYIEDVEVVEEIKRSRPNDVVPKSVEPRLAGWVRLGSWTYDAASPLTTQSFPLLDLKQFGDKAFSNHFVVRAKNNWNPEEVAYTCMYRMRITGDVVVKQ